LSECFIEKSPLAPLFQRGGPGGVEKPDPLAARCPGGHPASESAGVTGSGIGAARSLSQSPARPSAPCRPAPPPGPPRRISACSYVARAASSAATFSGSMVSSVRRHALTASASFSRSFSPSSPSLLVRVLAPHRVKGVRGRDLTPQPAGEHVNLIGEGGRRRHLAARDSALYRTKRSRNRCQA